MGHVARRTARRGSGVLSALQERVARIVAALPEADGFALAGGAALVVMQVVDRATRDPDYFGPSADEVDRLLPAVESALGAAGLDVRRERVTHWFARLTVADWGEVTEVDLAADARIRPVDDGPLGPTLSLEELAADKLVALFDRAQARDFRRRGGARPAIQPRTAVRAGQREGQRVLHRGARRHARQLFIDSRLPTSACPQTCMRTSPDLSNNGATH